MTKVLSPHGPPRRQESRHSPPRLPAGQFTAITKALSDPRRYGILSEIASARDALSCCALKAADAVSAATISHHIKSLEAAGLIEVVHDGKFVRMSFRRDTFAAYLHQLATVFQPPA
jgi:ArsR family transcriptional regulator, arsenate/arsenite/antimonite-responsive transcriptional repressor